ncbi:phosphotransferase [Pseudonocardia endophytica]|uniref:Phosphotransferase family enzyme n=1 Tax=Pseudonocardia endophytica TaxID=401976 RepID=A0A4R1HZW7_PSEEN|nr:phosphotransferase [Pseudonocardia endophytica]TCK27133.1 phosphotransferase family enzyme [Pseudonocardia endophytica]
MPGRELTERQRELLDEWLPGAVTTKDHSWGLLAGTTVLELLHDGERHIVKAAAAGDKHIAREVRAHRHWLTPWTSQDRAPSLVHADVGAGLLVTRHLPGDLMLGHPDEFSPELHRQAGALLAAFHGQYSVEDAEYEARAKSRILSAMDDRPHRIAPDTEARVRAEIEAWPTPVVTLVPTHGDWHPRNWLVDNGEVKVIDFGRVELRPAETDLVRLAAQQYRTVPALWAAFLAGYGSDPRTSGAWRRRRLYEAVATATWARLVDDEPFERQGHRMIADVLAEG